jgi:molybdenum cofactor synthesis domain-containing protein
MNVAVVTVGDELLAGETVDTNAAWLAERLTARGATVRRVATVPDAVDEIAGVVESYRDAYDAVLVTGGLGPTHDDVTVDGVAAALGRRVVENEVALSWLVEEGGYAREDLAAGTADLPAGARPLHNEVGVAPGCVAGSVYVLPGVPAEMKAMFERVAGEFDGQTVHATAVEAAEPESALLDRIEAVRGRFDGLSVGSYPGETVTVRLKGADAETVDRAADWLAERVETPD